jgi:beta-lactam-binding protein with PASTA domain
VIEQETEDESMDGRVISQAPSAGTQIRAADQVTIYVGVFTPPPEEPEVPEDPDAPKQKAARP